jgi:thioredoxin 1
MTHLREINAAEFDTAVLRATEPVVVDFYAPWCGPCKMLAPVLDQVAGELAGQVRMVKLNVDDAHELAARYGITGVPTLKLFRDGKAVDEVVGMAPPATLKRWLQQAATAVPA